MLINAIEVSIVPCAARRLMQVVADYRHNGPKFPTSDSDVMHLWATKIPASGRNRDLKETYTFEAIILVLFW